jgi:hypothetical protein
MRKLPQQIKLTITEKDVKAARDYVDSCNCLVATALKRRGLGKVEVSPFQVTIKGTSYSGRLFPNDIGYDASSRCYSNAVGKTHVLCRQ